MAPLSLHIIFSTTIFLLLLTISPSKATLEAHYYDQTCPQAEDIIYQVVRNASSYDPKVPARLLRMFFHDCFIRGCDASVLLDSTPGNKAEKDGPPNISLRAFYVIDDAKTKLEKACPRTVSCADIVAIAARDVVAMSGGPHWNVLIGRKDGRISRANETINLPAPSFNTSQLIQSFAKRGLGVKDLVALSGGHTLGFSHCSSFEARLRNFSSVHDTDPSLNAVFAESLKKNCPKPNRDSNAGQLLDTTSSVFDNNYYKQIVAGKGVFASDQSLLNDYRTGWIVKAFANDQSSFFWEFAASMVKLGNVGVQENDEVRLNCRAVN
ncbi:peroxidase 66 [Nicotiana sylvestris]|uniref:Peroxidase n=1 Tax=Nicotiana sylvestris TaxID=4096 RepID=A0A1U7W2N7_NICSY|nr:PREDICTED: peroxidase 66 [Nicotiana sylvestris]